MKWLKYDKGIKTEDNRVFIEFVYPLNSETNDNLPELFLLFIDGVSISHGDNLHEIQTLAEKIMKRREMMMKC